MKIHGTVVHESIEGGFWGIRGDDGENYTPVESLPTEYRKEGLHVEADVEPADVMSFTMWGKMVHLRKIRESKGHRE